MAIPQNILERMQKLQNMTFENGCTPNEAAFAAEKLQKMLTEHQMSIADIAGGDIAESIEELKILNDGGNKKWRVATIKYAGCIGQSFDCRTLVYRSHHITFIGMASDAMAAKFFFESTKDSVREAGKIAGRNEGYRGPALTSYCDQFLLGAGLGIQRQIARKKQVDVAEAASCCALVPIKHKKVEEYMDEKHADCKTDRRRTPIKEGFDSGLAHGMNMNLARPVAGRSPIAALGGAA